jgi:prepilin-type N-terminal cleavage/methylation domain-containing protein
MYIVSSHNIRGFTLTETVVVIALYTILSLAIFGSVTQLYKFNSQTLEQANEVEVARRGVATWTRDVREMTLAANGAFPIVRVENHRMGFYSDIDKDLSVEYVEYVLSTTTLFKYTYEASGTPAVYSTTTPSRTEIISQYVQNIPQSQITFRYYNDSGTLLASPAAMISDIRYVTINTIVNIDPVRSPGEFLLQGSATPRNLKDNL